METTAGNLLETMSVRWNMITKGVIKPPRAVRTATKQLVDKLSVLPATEPVAALSQTLARGRELIKYTRPATGETLAQFTSRARKPIPVMTAANKKSAPAF